MADWALNQLTKITFKTYIPGSPGVPGDPGSPGTAAYSYWETVTIAEGGVVYSSLPPEFYEGFLGYRHFTINGIQVKCKLASQTFYSPENNAFALYGYSYPAQTAQRLVDVPAQPSVPPTPPVPPSPAQVISDYNLGWNSGAISSASLPVGSAVRWRFDAGAVGAAVGITSVLTPQGQSYAEMNLAVLATSGLFIVVANGAPVTTYQAFSTSDRFVISRPAGKPVEVLRNGVVIYTQSVPGEMVVDSSLYSGGDRIFDAEFVADAEGLYPKVGMTTISGLGAAPRVVRSFGPGTANGSVGMTSRTGQKVGSVSVNGSIYTATRYSTLTAQGAEAHPVPTFGSGTDKGEVGMVTLSAQEGVEFATGSGNAVMAPLHASGSGPGVANGYSGNFAGDSVAMAPMESSGSAGFLTPALGIGGASMPPMAASGSGATGEVSTAADAVMAPMVAIGSEDDYANGNAEFGPMDSFGTDMLGEIEGMATLTVPPFVLDATGWEGSPNQANLRIRRAFSAQAYGGATGSPKVPPFTVDAIATGASVGWLQEAIGYA